MKWLLVKLVMLLVVGAGILNYVMYLKTGKSPLASIEWTLPSFSVPDMASIKHAMPDVELPSLAAEGEPIAVYKWVDANGVINYSQQNPGEAIAAEVMMVDPETNVVQADKLPEPDAPQEEPEAQSQGRLPQSQGSLPDVQLLPTPDRVKQLMDDAKGIQAKMDERTKAINGILNNTEP